jgi:signal peptidase I
MEARSEHAPREPWLAVNLSALLAGLGQIYSGRMIRGIILLAIEVLCIFAIIWLVLSETGNAGIALLMIWPLIALHIWNIPDAYRCASRTNTGAFETQRRQTKDAWLAVFLTRLLPGIGHFYLKRILWGIVFLIGAVVLISVGKLPFGRVLWGVYLGLACYAAYVSCKGRRETLRAMVVAVPVLICFQICLLSVFSGRYQAFRVPTSSMAPTLRPGDFILVEKGRITRPERGDVVVLVDPRERKKMIKRVVAVGGESVSMEAGRIYVDGSELRMEPFNDLPREELMRRPGLGEFSWNIPRGYLFVMGDNVLNSFDSRQFGPIPIDDVIGPVFKIYWPLSRAAPVN